MFFFTLNECNVLQGFLFFNKINKICKIKIKFVSL